MPSHHDGVTSSLTDDQCSSLQGMHRCPADEPCIGCRGQGAGLCAAAFMGLIPSYISRSVAGSFDLEGVAIFALVFTFYLYVKVRIFVVACGAAAIGEASQGLCTKPRHAPSGTACMKIS